MVAFAGVAVIVIIGVVIVGACYYGYCKLTRFQETKDYRETRWDYVQKRHDAMNKKLHL